MKKQLTLIAQSMAAVTAMLAAGGASASGFQLLEQNASGLGDAYAGSAANAENASVLYYNPAAMTKLRAREVSVGVNGIGPSYKFSNDNSKTGVLSGEGGDAGGWAAVPNMYASIAATDRLYLGLGIGAPFGLETSYDSPWYGAAQSLKFKIETININPSIAFKVMDNFSIGAGINWQKVNVDYQRTAGVGPTPLPGIGVVPLNAFTAEFHANDDAWGWNVGALYDATNTTRIGLSYRSTIKYTVSGPLNVSGPSAALGNALSSDASAEVKMPDTVILSVTQQLSSHVMLLGDISWTGWSSIPKVDIQRTSGLQSGTTAQTLDTDFRDTWRFAVGVNYRLDDTWTFKGGMAYDQTPVKGAETRLTSLPDNDRIWFSTGVQWKPNRASALDLGVSYLYIDSASIHNDQSSTGRGVVDGKYDGSVFIVGLQYSLAF